MSLNGQLRHTFAISALLALSLGVSCPIFAQPAETTDGGSDVTSEESTDSKKTAISAEDLYQLAIDHFNNRRWQQAAAAFELALQQDPNPVLAYNVGRSYEYTGDLDKAENNYFQALKLNPEPELRALLNTNLERIANIKAEVGTQTNSVGLVDISSTPEGATIVINGIEVGKTPYQAAHPAGTLVIQLEQDGYGEYAREFKLEPGREIVLDTNLERTGRLWTWISLGTGAVLIGGGVWAGIEAQSKLDDADSVEGKRQDESAYNALKEEGQNLALTSIILYSAGTLATAAAVGLYFYESPELVQETQQPAEEAQIDMLWGPGFIGVGGTF